MNFESEFQAFRSAELDFLKKIRAFLDKSEFAGDMELSQQLDGLIAIIETLQFDPKFFMPRNVRGGAIGNILDLTSGVDGTGETRPIPFRLLHRDVRIESMIEAAFPQGHRYHSLVRYYFGIRTSDIAREIKKHQQLKPGMDAAMAGDLRQAIIEFSVTIECHQDNATAWFLRGCARQDLGDLNGAASDFNCAIDLTPHDPEFRMRRALLRKNRNDFDRAMEDAEVAVACDAGNAQAWTIRGIVRKCRQDYKGAMSDCLKALRINPRYVWAWNVRAWIQIGLGHWKTALRYLNRALQLDADYGPARTNRACAYIELRRFRSAVADCTRGLAKDARNLDMWLFRALARGHLGDFHGALRDCAKALEIDRASAWGYSLQGFLKACLGDYLGGARDCSRALQIFSEYPDALANRAWAYVKLDRKKPAIADLKRAIELAPKHWKDLPWAKRNLRKLLK